MFINEHDYIFNRINKCLHSYSLAAAISDDKMSFNVKVISMLGDVRHLIIHKHMHSQGDKAFKRVRGIAQLLLANETTIHAISKLYPVYFKFCRARQHNVVNVRSSKNVKPKMPRVGCLHISVQQTRRRRNASTRISKILLCIAHVDVISDKLSVKHTYFLSSSRQHVKSSNSRKCLFLALNWTKFVFFFIEKKILHFFHTQCSN